MRAAPILVGSSLLVFVVMFQFMNATEGVTLVLFPVGALLAVAGLVMGAHGAFRGRGRSRTVDAVAAGVGVILVGFTVLGVLAFLWLIGVLEGPSLT